MKWTRWFSGILAQQLPPQTLVDQLVEVWPQVWERIPHEQRVDFLEGAAKKYLGVFLTDLNRAERVSLMNALLPLVAHEFPLADLDFLTAFSTPVEGYQKDASAEDR